MPSKPLHLLVVGVRDAPVRYYLLGAASIRIGRIAGNDLVVAEDSVSAAHCELRRDASGGYSLADLGSTNGTSLNGEPVGADPVALRDGDVLLFGSIAEAHYVRVQEIRARDASPTSDGSSTRRLDQPEMPPRPSINPVAAAMAKAARARAKPE